jgi:hypothetical protein
MESAVIYVDYVLFGYKYAGRNRCLMDHAPLLYYYLPDSKISRLPHKV